MDTKNGQLYPVALTIAGSDSGGGAGIQADLRTFNAFGVFGCCALTAATAQNPFSVKRIDAMPPESVTAQIDAVAEKLTISCAKSGMLFSADIIDAVAAAVRRHDLRLICDPVMVSTSGCRLLAKDAEKALMEKLFPLADMITPNIPEAEIILGRKLSNFDDLADGAKELARKYDVDVLLKGGHMSSRGDRVVDFAVLDGKSYEISAPTADVEHHAAHGTGCTLSAAIAACIAEGIDDFQAICEAKAFVYGSLLETVRIGRNLDAMYPPTKDNIDLVTWRIL